MTTIAAGLGWTHRELMTLEHRERRWWAERARMSEVGTSVDGSTR